MSRLLLVLDEESGLPVWFNFIPGNAMDLNTIIPIINDVSDTHGIEIDSLVLAAGYVSEDPISDFHISTRKIIIGRMPNHRGYPYKVLYWELKARKIELFGHNEYAYIYVERYNALKR